MRRRAATLAVIAGLALSFVAGPSASATTGTDATDPQILAVMAEVPGGVLIDARHAVWPALDMILTVPNEGSLMTLLSVGGCATGRVCAFASPSLGGAILSWGTCGYHAVPSSFVVRSIADARLTGKAQARSGATVLATANAGAWANVTGTADNILCLF